MRQLDLETERNARRQAEVGQAVRGGGWRLVADGLIRGAIPETAVHLCIDMQRMFAEDTPGIRRGWSGCCPW